MWRSDRFTFLVSEKLTLKSTKYFWAKLYYKTIHFCYVKDVSLCDTMVLIVNSRTDRQVFTVAGRDAKLSREVLQTAFHRNVGHFRSGNYALGLHGMIEYIVSAYGSAHIVQVPSPTTADGADSGALLGSTNSAGSGQFVATAQGVRQQSKMAERFNIESVPEDDRIWVQILLKASSLCGYDTKMMARNVRAVVEGKFSNREACVRRELLEKENC